LRHGNLLAAASNHPLLNRHPDEMCLVTVPSYNLLNAPCKKERYLASSAMPYDPQLSADWALDFAQKRGCPSVKKHLAVTLRKILNLKVKSQSTVLRFLFHCC
jgi:hypothetical protein